MRPCEARVTQGRAGAGPGLRRVWGVRYSVCGPASQLNGVWGFRSPQIVIALCPWG